MALPPIPRAEKTRFRRERRTRRLPHGDEPPAVEAQDVVGSGGDGIEAGDHHDGAPYVVGEAGEDVQDLCLGLGVEVVLGLVGDDDGGVVDSARAMPARCCPSPESLSTGRVAFSAPASVPATSAPSPGRRARRAWTRRSPHYPPPPAPSWRPPVRRTLK